MAVVLSGLDALRDALRKLPADLVDDASVVVKAAGDDMARQLQTAYPLGPPRKNVPSGNLRAHVRVDLTLTKFSATARVKNTARHAWLFDHGSAPRRWKKNGKSTGAMPARPTFIPVAVVERHHMHAGLIDVLHRAGLTVTGTP